MGDESEEELIEQYYVYAVYNDIVIEEVNVDPIEDYIVTINGEVLAEGDGLVSTQTSGEGEWSKRTYVIDKENFDAEGEYTIVVESTDKAGTKAYSDVKNLSISFVVDQTAPILTISGLEQGGRYQTDEQIIMVPGNRTIIVYGARLSFICLYTQPTDFGKLSLMRKCYP